MKPVIDRGNSKPLKKPKKLAVYRGSLSSVNNEENRVDIINEFTSFDAIILNLPVNEFEKEIVADLVATGKDVFIRILLGNSGNENEKLTQSEIEEIIDSLIGFSNGIFFDQCGYEYGTTREEQLNAFTYAKEKGFKISVNASRYDDVFAKVPDEYPHKNLDRIENNPDRLEPFNFTEDDMLIIAPLGSTSKGYEESTGIYGDIGRAIRAESFARKYKMKIGTITFTITEGKTNDPSDPPEDLQREIDYAYKLAHMIGADYYCVAHENLGENQNTIIDFAPSNESAIMDEYTTSSEYAIGRNDYSRLIRMFDNDLYVWEKGKAIKTNVRGGISLDLVGFQYGQLYPVLGVRNVGYCIQKLSRYHHLAIAPYHELTNDSKEVLRGVIKNGVKVYAYIHAGETDKIAPMKEEEVKRVIDDAAKNGFYGIFIDMAGYDYKVTREKFNRYVDYLHSKGLVAFVNAWRAPDVLSSNPHALNPNGLKTSLGEGDWFLYESFYSSSAGQYVDESTNLAYRMSEYMEWTELAHSLGVKVASLAYTIDEENEDRDLLNSYVMSLICNLDGWSFHRTLDNGSFGISYPAQLGLTFLGPAVQRVGGRWERMTDKGLIWFEIESGERESGFVVDGKPAKYCLTLDGVNDVLLTPMITFDEIIIDATPYQKENTWQYYVDARWAHDFAWLLRDASNNDHSSDQAFKEVYYNGERLISGTPTIQRGQRGIIRIVCEGPLTDDVNIFSNAGSDEKMEADVYEVKFLLNGELVAHYDFTTGTIIDQTGNYQDVFLIGGGWKKENE